MALAFNIIAQVVFWAYIFLNIVCLIGFFAIQAAFSNLD